MEEKVVARLRTFHIVVHLANPNNESVCNRNRKVKWKGPKDNGEGNGIRPVQLQMD